MDLRVLYIKLGVRTVQTRLSTCRHVVALPPSVCRGGAQADTWISVKQMKKASLSFGTAKSFGAWEELQAKAQKSV